jgi:hypothetical protein
MIPGLYEVIQYTLSLSRAPRVRQAELGPAALDARWGGADGAPAARAPAARAAAAHATAARLERGPDGSGAPPWRPPGIYYRVNALLFRLVERVSAAAVPARPTAHARATAHARPPIQPSAHAPAHATVGAGTTRLPRVGAQLPQRAWLTRGRAGRSAGAGNCWGPR